MIPEVGGGYLARTFPIPSRKYGKNNIFNNKVSDNCGIFGFTKPCASFLNSKKV